MLEPQERKRYSRQILVPEIGTGGQEKLKSARVLVVGAGGLGCPVLQYLAAAGVGHLGIVDNDTVDVTNLHRQILFNQHDIGLNKAECAKIKLSALNPHIAIDIHPVRLTTGNVTDILSKYDLIVDGSDNFPTRYLVDDACRVLGKPMVFGSVLRFEGQVSVFNFRNGPTYRSLFADADEGDNCEIAGVMNVLPGIVGTYMASEVIKIICGIGDVLSGRLLLIDLLKQTSAIFQFEGSAQPVESISPKTEVAGLDGLISYETFEKLQESQSVTLIDVREDYEFEADNFGGTNIPLSEIADHISSFNPENPVVFYCHSGKRSKIAAKLLTNSGFTGKSYWGAGW